MRKHSTLSLRVLLVYDHHQHLNFPAEKKRTPERERTIMITDTFYTLSLKDNPECCLAKFQFHFYKKESP